MTVLGAEVSVNYQHERQFASAAAALARTGRQVFDLTWRWDYELGTSNGWDNFAPTRTNRQRPYISGSVTNYITKFWGMDHWASRVGQGAYINWVVGNAILPAIDSEHQGIQKVDRTTVPELPELTHTAAQLQTDMDNAEAGFTPLGLSQNSVPFDIDPLQVTGPSPKTHFEQVYERAVAALNNAVVAFNDAQSVSQTMRSEEDSLADFQAGVFAQELAYNNQLVEIYGTPYPDDMGPGKTYPQDYTGPDLIHYTYVENPDTNDYGGLLADPTTAQTFNIDIQQLPPNWTSKLYQTFDFITESTASDYGPTDYITFNIGPNGFFDKPASWPSRREVPGTIQQAISGLIAAKNRLRTELANAVGDKQSLDKTMEVFLVQSNAAWKALAQQNWQSDIQQAINQVQADLANQNAGFSYAEATLDQLFQCITASIPDNFVFGLANGGDLLGPARMATGLTYIGLRQPFMLASLIQSVKAQNQVVSDQQLLVNLGKQMNHAQLDDTLQNQVLELASLLGTVQGHLSTINDDLQKPG